MLSLLREVVHQGNSAQLVIHSVKLLYFAQLVSSVHDLEVYFYLFFQSYGAKDKNLWRRKHRNLTRCLDIRLKTIVLKNYWGMMSQVNFATFFVSNARMLEFMRFEVGIGNVNKMFIAEQHRKLQLEKRASRNAQFCFTSRDRCRRTKEHFHVKHVSDLSITDPFECRC